MSFWWLQFSHKMNKNNSTWGTILVKWNCFVRFLGELKIPKRHFEMNWPLERNSYKKSKFKKCMIDYCSYYIQSQSSRTEEMPCDWLTEMHFWSHIFWVWISYLNFALKRAIFSPWLFRCMYFGCLQIKMTIDLNISYHDFLKRKKLDFFWKFVLKYIDRHM